MSEAVSADHKHDHHHHHDHSHHDHDHAIGHTCPIHEPLTEKQVKGRLNNALISGVLLLSGGLMKGLGQEFSGTLLEIIACLLLAGPILRDSCVGICRGHIGFPSLVALAFLACISQGEYLTAGLVAFFMIMADQLENRTAIGAGKAIETLIRETPDTVHLQLESGQTEDRSLSAVKVGEIVHLRPGETIPIDGVIVEGESSVDESSITGESLPVDKSIDVQVYAGTTNLTGLLRVRIEKLGDDTTLGKVKRLILSASNSKLPLMSLMEKNAGWYTPLVIMFAALVFYFKQGDPNALKTAITILIMACPCSLVLATPSVMIAAITAAARAGILVKNVVELEHFHKIEHVFFDKTGTLTTGNMTLSHMDNLADLNNAEILSFAGSLAANSNHPSARGVSTALEKARLGKKSFEGVEEFHGKGLSGQFEGEQYWLGRPEWVCETLGLESETSGPVGSKMLFASKSKGLLARFTLEDHLRDDAKQSVSRLREFGIRQLSLLTGDTWEPARKVAKAVGFDQVYAKCLPDDKLKYLEESKEKGHKTAVVGDGINDAPVLAAGDVGIAMGALGSQVAIESASIALMTSNLDRLPFLYKLSRGAKMLIWVNIIIGILVIAIGLLLSVLDQMHPIAAAILHNFSAMIILFNSARLIKMQP